jgi:peroxiredoxin
VLEPGDRMPDVTVWTAPRQSSTTRELLAEGPLLLTFYLFDWSST